MVFWKKKGKKKNFKNLVLVEDTILTVQKSSTFHCLDPNCVRRCNNKSSGFYLFTNRIWLYCCTVFCFFFSFWVGDGGVYSSEVPDLMNRVCVCVWIVCVSLDALCRQMRVLPLEGKMWGYGWEGGGLCRCVCVWEQRECKSTSGVCRQHTRVNNIHLPTSDCLVTMMHNIRGKTKASESACVWTRSQH